MGRGRRGNPAITAVLPLGDEQYENGALAEFQAAYAQSWGRALAKTHPVRWYSFHVGRTFLKNDPAKHHPTGGRSLDPFPGAFTNGQFRQDTQFGVLKLTLHPHRYEWRFVNTAKHVLDSGETDCH